MVEEFFQGSQIFPRESNFALAWAAMPQMMNDTNDLPTCSPRPVGFAAGKN